MQILIQAAENDRLIAIFPNGKTNKVPQPRQLLYLRAIRINDVKLPFGSTPVGVKKPLRIRRPTQSFQIAAAGDEFQPMLSTQVGTPHVRFVGLRGGKIRDALAIRGNYRLAGVLSDVVGKLFGCRRERRTHPGAPAIDEIDAMAAGIRHWRPIRTRTKGDLTEQMVAQ